MNSENPWEGLSPNSMDARRVDHTVRHDFFWFVSAQREPGMLLRLSPDTDRQVPVPRMRNLDVGYSNAGGRDALIIALRDDEQRSLFATLCRDIVEGSGRAETNPEALTLSLKRTLRWHHLLRGGRPDILSVEEQRGLLGELHFLRHLVALVGARGAVEAWKGPSGAAKDFELSGCLVEVKARRGAARPYVQISSEDQLADIDGARLFLTVVDVDAAIKPAGMTLTDYVRDMDQLIAAADVQAYQAWEETLTATGFDYDDDYSDRRWTVGKSILMEVKEEFPRIKLPLIPGVANVRYSIALDACAPFQVDADDIDNLILEGSLS